MTARFYIPVMLVVLFDKQMRRKRSHVFFAARAWSAIPMYGAMKSHKFNRHYLIINEEDMVEYEFIVDHNGESFVYDSFDKCIIRIRESDVYKSIKDLSNEEGKRLVFKAKLCA